MQPVGNAEWEPGLQQCGRGRGWPAMRGSGSNGFLGPRDGGQSPRGRNTWAQGWRVRWGGRAGSVTLQLAFPSLRRSREGFQPESRIKVYFTTWKLFSERIPRNFELCLPLLAVWLLASRFSVRVSFSSL